MMCLFRFFDAAQECLKDTERVSLCDVCGRTQNVGVCCRQLGLRLAEIRLTLFSNFAIYNVSRTLVPNDMHLVRTCC